ncbi:MAG: bacteriohemerythrin [Bacteroidales bacterium]|jgi:hemerythrin-like metal-binding protein|nr:bacteriohemerythrin [Bacteroidales bacterium]
MSEYILFEWDEEFNTGIPEIDNQHKALVGLLNSLFNLLREGKARNEVSEALNQLTAYSEVHFKTEEAFFIQYSYPETETHIACHNAFIDKIDSFRDQMTGSNLTLSIDVFKYLKLWLQEHILGEDMKYRDYFKEQGITV